MSEYHFVTPLNQDKIVSLHIKDIVYISGHIYTSRDMAHLKYAELIREGKPLPKDFSGSAIFHAGPVCLKEANDQWHLSLIGPTTSIRMEPYAEMVGKMGIKAIIGKGGMGESTAMQAKKYTYVYLQAAPGCAAKLARCVQKVVSVDYFEMGMPEALWDLEVKEFGPLVVGMDSYGESIYQQLRCNALNQIKNLC